MYHLYVQTPTENRVQYEAPVKQGAKGESDKITLIIEIFKEFVKPYIKGEMDEAGLRELLQQV